MQHEVTLLLQMLEEEYYSSGSVSSG